MNGVDLRKFSSENAWRGFDGLADLYFSLCDAANATDRPCDTPEFKEAEVLRACAEISYGELAGIRIGMMADLRLPDDSDGFLGFANRRIDGVKK